MAWIALFAFVASILLKAFSLAEFVFAKPLVIAVGLTFAAVGLLCALLGPDGRRWGVLGKVAVAGFALMLAVCAGVVGYLELSATRRLSGKVERRAVLVGAPIDVPGHPVKSVFDPANRTLLVGDRRGSVRSIDVETGLPVGSPQRIGRSIGDLELLRGFLYATVSEGRLIRVRVGPAQRRIVSVRYGTENGEIVYGDGSIWVNDRAGGRVLRYSLDLELIAPIPLGARKGARATSLAFGGSEVLWVTDSGLNALYRIDPEANRVVTSKSVLPNPDRLDVAGSVVYVAHPGIRRLVRHDGLTGKQLPGLTRIEPGATTVTVATGGLYLCSVQNDRIVQVSPVTGKRTGSALPTGLSPTDVVVGPNGREMWVINSGSGSITPISIGG